MREVDWSHNQLAIAARFVAQAPVYAVDGSYGWRILTATWSTSDITHVVLKQ